ncbi:hypothetical protein [Streptomyces sp. NPDC056987]|uniref:hypothetical protein n=1 Tax=Streptomyces sp. NPDC056987 TaxID=3345988 RepID=UPI00362A56B5
MIMNLPAGKLSPGTQHAQLNQVMKINENGLCIRGQEFILAESARSYEPDRASGAPGWFAGLTGEAVEVLSGGAGSRCVGFFG